MSFDVHPVPVGIHIGTFHIYTGTFDGVVKAGTMKRRFKSERWDKTSDIWISTRDKITDP